MAIDYTKKLRMLLVGDLAAHRATLASAILIINPFIRIDQAASLSEAIDKLSGNAHNAVIAEWRMATGGADELASWMRARDDFREVAFITISEKNHREDIIQAFMQSTVDAYVVKPFKPIDLFEKVMTAIEQRRVDISYPGR